MAPVSVGIVTFFAVALSSCVGGSDPGPADVGSSESALQSSDLDTCVGDAMQTFLDCTERQCGATAPRVSDKCVESCRGQASGVLRECLVGSVQVVVTGQPTELDIRKFRETEQRIDLHPGAREDIHPDW